MAETRYDPIKYKIGSRDNWNAVASDYHYGWADKGIGPFGSTAEVVRLADIHNGHAVLDLGCGTGAISQQAYRYLSPDGLLVGIDLSYVALCIARKSLPFPNAEFCVMDAENMSLNTLFDRVVCQYALMFFPDADMVLRNARSLIRNGGRISIAVHGSAEGVPYFSTIMGPILEQIPDIRPQNAPTVHRFGNAKDLREALESAGFVQVEIKKLVFHYEAGTFEQYWSDYLASTANAIRRNIEASGSTTISAIKESARERSMRYTHQGKISFPWDVLVATAING